jgi:hypothetical protein
MGVKSNGPTAARWAGYEIRSADQPEVHAGGCRAERLIQDHGSP